MITSTTLFFSISGTDIPGCISLELEQGIHSHHSFRAYFPGSVLESDSLGFGEQSMKKIGMPVKIGLCNTVGHEMVFNGIITSVNVLGSHQSGQGQTIVFEGYSSTILLENGPSCRAFTDMPLSQIITKVANGTDNTLLKLVVQPQFDIQQPYTVQYNETAFSFINRVSKRYGEWCYYDGVNLVIGNKKQPSFTLFYGSDLHSFSVNMQAPAVHRHYVAHSYISDENFTLNTKDKKPALKGTIAQIYELAHKTWQSPEPAIAMHFDESNAFKKQMDDFGKGTVDGVASQTLYFSGESINPSLFPGAFISMQGAQSRDYGSFIILSVNHRYSVGGQYQNTFTAIPASTTKSPMTDVQAIPYCDTQSGVVTDNNDPEGLGRVKVKLYWQRDTQTPWLRIALPYTGADKGMYFIPEKGEEVMVGFEGGNAEKPYVAGSLYHGKMKPNGFAHEKNDIKAIRTRSGHTIEFRDTNGGECITISDVKGNTIQLDTVSGSIQISAPENLSFSAKNIDINASENITFGARDNMNLYAGEDFTVAARNTTTQAEENAQILAKTIEHNADKIRVDSKKDPLELASAKTVDLQSGEKVRLF